MIRAFEGRVWARDGASIVLGDALARHAIACGAELLEASDVREGDLARVRAEPCAEGWRARSIERVFRPRRAVMSRASETGRMVGGRLAERLVGRALVVARVRECFVEQGFVEVDTPSIAVCPGLDLHLCAYRAADTSGGESPGFLVTSPEYHMKRLVVGGLSRCFQLARCFRAGEKGSRHEPEFTMLEWYRAWGSLDDLLEDTARVVRAACDSESVPRQEGGRVALDREFERLSVREAFARWAPEVSDPIGLAERDEGEYFRLLGERIEPELGREVPTFLTHFAARHASLSQLDPSDPSVCLRAELYVDGMELSNGFVELTDPVEQRARFERDARDRDARGLPSYPIDEAFLSALEEGMPPCVGNAMGLDRLVAVALGTRDLRDVLAFSHRVE